jgi:hypothetical protein
MFLLNKTRYIIIIQPFFLAFVQSVAINVHNQDMLLFLFSYMFRFSHKPPVRGGLTLTSLKLNFLVFVKSLCMSASYIQYPYPEFGIPYD